MSDFKELVPEFYDTSNGGDFLMNKYGIDFGYRYNGAKVGDVQLPPWAEGNQIDEHFEQLGELSICGTYLIQFKDVVGKS